MAEIENITVVEKAITIDMMPIGPMWEADGACWRADIDAAEKSGWRWHPLNWEAFAKENPEGEMSELHPANLAGLMRAVANG